MKTHQRPWWEQVLRGEKQGFWADSLRSVARLGSMGYAWGVRGRDLAYGKGWMKSQRLKQPTLCIGNITVGGTGKTPLVMKICQDLQARDLRPAVLLRGYKRQNKRRRPLVVRDANQILVSVADSGDEAMELARRLPGVIVGVGVNRYAVGRYLSDRYPIDCFVLDDGFQHHALGRDINIVTIDVTDPWGGGQLLPAGLLRETPAALERADAVVLTRTGLVGPDRLATLRQEVSVKMSAGSCLLESRHEPQSLISLSNPEDALPLSTLDKQSVLVVSGIGNPDAFVAGLRPLGVRIAGQFNARDHSTDHQALTRWLTRYWREGQLVLTTEKDAMRWSDPSIFGRAWNDSYALRMRFVLTQGQTHWEKLLNTVKTLALAD